jgi:hypothetical protein
MRTIYKKKEKNLKIPDEKKIFFLTEFGKGRGKY